MPVGERGTILTVWFKAFPSYQGAFAEQLAVQEAYQRKRIKGIADRRRQQVATGVASQADLDEALGLQDESPRYYKIEVIARHKTLSDLSNASGIFGVTLGRDKAEAYREFDNQGLKRPLDRMFQDSSDASESGSASSGSPDGSAPAGQTPISELSSIGGGSSTMQSVAWGCGPSVSIDLTCPTDQNYLPANRYFSDAFHWFYSELHAVWDTEYQTWTVEGNFDTDLKWSNAEWQGIKTNTAAFSASQLPWCIPIITGPSAVCGWPINQTNVTYVPLNAYENEGFVPNDDCQLSTRTGDTYDMIKRCHLATFAFSFLPDAYLDTTELDDGDVFKPTVGSASPDEINPGQNYATIINFEAWNTSDIHLGDSVSHGGQIGHRFEPLCIFGSALCVFSVDTPQEHLWTSIYEPAL